jgi:hypothetical protein
MQGKAIHYYREALERDPENLAAISGEGEALVEKGAVEKARATWPGWKAVRQQDCDAAASLPPRSPRAGARVVTAEAVNAEPVVSS